jgi:hypothetical protein
MSQFENSLFPSEITKGVSKKEIVAIAEHGVKEQVDSGYINPLQELITAMRIKTFAEAREKTLRPFALKEMREDKETVVLSAKVSKSKEAGRWQFDDPYINELEEELKIVKEKAKLQESRNRMHVTLNGEAITINPGVSYGGGEDAIRVTL